MKYNPEKLSVDEVNEQYRWIAELIGVDNLIVLCENAGGSSPYIPKMENLFKNVKYSELISKFNGYNIRELAQEFGVSTRTVRRLVQHLINKKRNAPFEGQITLEDFK